MQMLTDLSRLSLNTATTQHWSVAEAVDGCARAGIPWISLWRDSVAEVGVAESAQLVRDAGMRIASLCRGGLFPAATAAERKTRIDDNLRAIDEAAEIGTDLLVLVCGPAPDKNLSAAREMVAEGIAAVLPYAAERGVRLGIEPINPMYTGDRSVIVTLAQANALVERFASPWLGVVTDAYHVWWDPDLDVQLARAGKNIFAFHVSDWLLPMPDPLLGRGMMGDGVIDIRGIRARVEAAGYTGPIEVEIYNQTIWDTPGDEVLAQVAPLSGVCVTPRTRTGKQETRDKEQVFFVSCFFAIRVVIPGIPINIWPDSEWFPMIAATSHNTIWPFDTIRLHTAVIKDHAQVIVWSRHHLAGVAADLGVFCTTSRLVARLVRDSGERRG